MTLMLDHPEQTVTRVRRRRRRSARKKARNVLLVVGACVVASALVAGAYLYNLAQNFDSGTGKITAAFPAEDGRPGQKSSAMNILVMGSDSRDALELNAANETASDQRADTLMLIHIPADRQHVYTMSIMRDLWVEIPGHGEAKVNSALAHGGVPLMVQTVESILDQRINHVALVDFESFRGLTNALGGVDVEVKSPFLSSGPGAHAFNAGLNSLDGTEALAFVRERYAFPDGDYQRVRNQQAYLKGVIDKAATPGTLLNPVKVSNMLGSVTPFLSVDEGLDSEVLTRLAFELKDLGPGDSVMFILPTLGTGISADGQSIVLPDPAGIEGIRDAAGAGSLSDYLASHPFPASGS